MSEAIEEADESAMTIEELQDYVELADAAVERAEQEADRRRAILSERKASALLDAAVARAVTHGR